MYTSSGKGFISNLLDFSFSRFVSVDLIRVLYIVLIILAVVATIAGIIAAFGNSLSAGIGALILSPVILFLYIIFMRVFTEFFIVIFMIAEDVNEIAQNTKKES